MGALQRIASIVRGGLLAALTVFHRAISSWLFRLQPEMARENDVADFHPLTPALLNRSDIQEYEKQLNNVLVGKICKGIRNIAITGSYAVGKSSFIRTFLHYNAEYRNTPIISMAKFGLNEAIDAPEMHKKAEQSGTPEPNSAVEEKRHIREQVEIEKSILEQLLYSAEPQQISLSSVRRLKDASVFQVFFVLLLVLSALRLFPSVWGELVTPYKSWVDLTNVPVWIAHGVILIFTCLILPKLIGLVRSYSITKFSIQGVDFEKQSHSSFLRENVDEFIYFFDKTKVQLVIFEDIDRLDASQAMAILTHIREVNRLVNLSRNNPVFFIYAVKDDLFKADDRTKFFDLIIPIIPVINSNNAYEKLAAALGLEMGRAEKPGELSPQLVKDVSLFFGDLRLIYNLANEYKIYKAKLSKDHTLDLNKLFALLAVKTMYPSVYTQLLVNKGPISDVVSRVDRAKDELKIDIETEMRSVVETIRKMKELISKRKEDLLATFWMCCAKSNGVSNFPVSIQLNGGTVHILQSLRPDSAFESFLLGNLGDKAQVLYGQNGSNFSAGDFSNPTKVTNSAGLNYKQCIELIAIDETEIEAELELLNRKLTEISDYQLEDLMQDSCSRKVLLEPLGDDFELAKLLLIHGYIEVDYADYTSFFYPGTISQADKVKVQRIKLLEKLPISTIFDKPAEVLEQLQHSDLANGRGLLKGLLPELIKVKNKAKLHSILSKSKPYISDILILWSGLSDKHSRCALLTALLEANLDAAVSTLKLIHDSPQHSEFEVRQFIVDMLRNEPGDSRLALKDCEIFGAIVSGLKGLDGLEAVKCDWFWRTPHIQYYQLENVPEDIAEKIMESGQFAINQVTLNALLQNALKAGVNCSLLSYESVLATDCDAFIERINGAIREFYELISDCDDWQESFNSAITLFEMEALSADDKLLIAQSTNSNFGLAVIPDDCLRRFISHDLLTVSWAEIHDAFDHLLLAPAVGVGADGQLLAQFIERHIEQLLDDSTDLQFSDDFIVSLLNSIASDEIFFKLVDWLEFDLDVLTKLKLKDSRWQLLVTVPSLRYSEDLFSIIQPKSASAAAMLLVGDWPERFEQLDDKGMVSPDAIRELFQSDKLHIEDKLYVYERYVDFNFTELSRLAVTLVEDALESGVDLPASGTDLMEQVRGHGHADLRAKVSLHYLSSRRSFNEVCDLLSMYGVSGLERLSEIPKIVSVPNTPVMNALLQRLQAMGFIGKVTNGGNEKLKGHLKTSVCAA
jgi:hypothetical protein